jgi:hypothetical protein
MAEAAVKRRLALDHFDALCERIRSDRLRKRVRWCDLAKLGLLSPQEWPAEKIAATVLYTLVDRLRDDRELDRNTACARIAANLGLANLPARQQWQAGYAMLKHAAEVGLINSIEHSGEGKGTVPVTLTHSAEKRMLGYLLKYELADLPQYPRRTRPEGVRIARPAGMIPPAPIPSDVVQQLERVQGTRWRVNKDVADVMLQCLDVIGKPGSERRLAVEAAVAVATKFRDVPAFYIPIYLDYRGRVYQEGALCYTGADHAIQALLEFADGEVIRRRGHVREPAVTRLAQYVAACWNAGRTDEERERWTIKNTRLLRNVAVKPLEHRDWIGSSEERDGRPKERDSFLALAAAIAWRDCLKGEPVHLPCSWDVSSSGLQIYAALMRDEQLGRRVGLVRGSTPTYYPTVGDKAGAKGKQQAKAAVVPMLYGASVETMARALAELEGVKKPTKAHKTLARRIRKEAKKHAVPLTQVNDWLLKEVFPKFMERGLPISWTTPSGFHVVQDDRYHETELLEIHNGDTRVRLAKARVSDALNYKAIRRALCANIIHSLDATLLVRTIKIASKDGPHRSGIGSWGVAHDCFAVPASKVDWLVSSYMLATQVFRRDVLVELWKDFERQLDGTEIEPPPHHPAKLPRAFGLGARGAIKA